MEMLDISFSCPCSTDESPCIEYDNYVLEEIFKGKKSRLPGIISAKASREAAAGIVEGETLRHCSSPDCPGTWRVQVGDGKQPETPMPFLQQGHLHKLWIPLVCLRFGHRPFHCNCLADHLVALRELLDRNLCRHLLRHPCHVPTCEQYATFLREQLPELLNQYTRTSSEAIDTLWDTNLARSSFLLSSSWNLIARLCQNGMSSVSVWPQHSAREQGTGRRANRFEELAGVIPSFTPDMFGPNVKDCPSCGARTFKDGGCNHMTCSLCHHSYCWMCLRVWRTCDCPQF